MTTDRHPFTQMADLQKLNPITEKIIGCAYIVSNTLGVGFLEKVYENALAHELRKSGLTVKQQYPIRVWYDSVMVGEYTADRLVEDCILIELKSVKSLDEIRQAQCINYLKATGFHLILLLNFGKPRMEIKRIAL